MKMNLPQVGIGAAWLALAALVVWIVRDLWVMTVEEVQMDSATWAVLLNLGLRTLPMTLLALALGLILKIVVQEWQAQTMTPLVRRWLFWLPRVAVLCFAFFLSLFALDVFGKGLTPQETVIALLLHLAPAALVLLVLAAAWRFARVGAAMLIGWALFYMVSAQGFSPGVYLMMAGLPAALGALFLLNWRYRAEFTNATAPPSLRAPDSVQMS